MNNVETYRDDLEALVKRGRALLDRVMRLANSKKDSQLDLVNAGSYQLWYTEACAVIKQLLPDRLGEFIQLYQGDGKRKNMLQANFNIQDWLRFREPAGMTENNQIALVYSLLLTQVTILESVRVRFESRLVDIRQMVQADLFDSELDAAREMAKRGFFRAAGALAGVVLEKHLLQVVENHNLKVTRKAPSIAALNDLLKENEVVEQTDWRAIQHLADLRNRCSHATAREPAEDEVETLLSGVEKYTKMLF